MNWGEKSLARVWHFTFPSVGCCCSCCYGQTQGSWWQKGGNLLPSLHQNQAQGCMWVTDTEWPPTTHICNVQTHFSTLCHLSCNYWARHYWLAKARNKPGEIAWLVHSHVTKKFQLVMRVHFGWFEELCTSTMVNQHDFTPPPPGGPRVIVQQSLKKLKPTWGSSTTLSTPSDSSG